ncbi:GGDEF domain-containing protein [Diplocloster agilis]|uniref:GGDEF domain-containing protein n=1 Tax=Diplocloster agilis TaxID=2850323 RepID=A0A949K1Q1_9FIRM|nr:diguanylate cyclase [Diplocloster agilis]MBU9738584.1 GGDEF domain-containing protein [Diplocloster agilis]
MIKNKKERVMPFLIGIVCIAAIAVLLWVAGHFQTQNVQLIQDGVEPLSKGWTYTVGEESHAITRFPFSLTLEEGEEVLLSCLLPDELPAEGVIMYIADHQNIQVYLEGRLIYEYGNRDHTPFGDVFGSVTNLIPVPKDAQGKQLSIRAVCPGKFRHYNYNFYPVYLGTKSAAVFNLFQQNFSSLCFCFIIVLLGITFIVAGVYMNTKKYPSNGSSFFYLGVFSLLAAAWILTDSNVMQLWYGKAPVIYIGSFFAFMLMTIPFLQYIRQIFVGGKRLLNVLSLLFVLNFVLSTIIYILGAAELFETNLMTHLLMLFSIGCIGILCYREKKVYHNREIRGLLTGLVILCAAGIFSIVKFYFSSHDNNSLYFRIGLLGFIVVLGFSTLKKSLLLVNTRAEAAAYRKLAYLDSMTMLGNRTAFDVQTEKDLQEQEGIETVAVVVCDLNDLKSTNDTYGHRVGDKMIIGFAKCLMEAFEGLGKTYRIGGDEFAVWFVNQREESIQEGIRILRETVEKQEPDSRFELKYACGYAFETMEEGKEIKFNRLFSRADANMYREKLEIKGLDQRLFD